MRALTPFPLTVIDGQHRAVLMVLFTCGYFFPSNEFILDGSVSLSEAPGARSGDFSRGDAQVWRQTKTCIGFAVNVEGCVIDDLNVSQAVLKRYGEVLTSAQAHSITFSWVQLYRDLNGVFQRAENNLPFHDKSPGKRLGFDFWSRSAEHPLDDEVRLDGKQKPGRKKKPHLTCSNWYIYEQRLRSVFEELVKYTKQNKTTAAFLFDNPLQKDVSSS